MEAILSNVAVAQGRYVDHTLIPDGQLPDVEGASEQVIMQSTPTPISIFDLIGKAARTRRRKTLPPRSS